MREEAYRDILESILKFTGGKHVLNKSAVGRYTGLGKQGVSRLNISSGGITAEALARKLAELSAE